MFPGEPKLSWQSRARGECGEEAKEASKEEEWGSIRLFISAGW
jgi:hypothetical protein